MANSPSPDSGFFIIDKPLTMTSHAVVAKIRRGLNIKKVGHAGTLDPLATGVLVVCVGYATRLSEYAMHTNKRYCARVHLGVETDTYDAEGTITQQQSVDHISQQMVEAALSSFVGEIAQLPPMYSAVKMNGKKLYDLARQGKTVERKARTVQINSLTLLEWAPPQFTLDVECSSGTYIRSLAHDLGAALGVGAHLAGLIRTASGVFSLEEALQLDDVLGAARWQDYLISPDVVLGGFPPLYLDEALTQQIQQGQFIEADYVTDAPLARAYGPDGRLIALLKPIKDGLWRPHKVFSTMNS